MRAKQLSCASALWESGARRDGPNTGKQAETEVGSGAREEHLMEAAPVTIRITTQTKETTIDE